MGNPELKSHSSSKNTLLRMYKISIENRKLVISTTLIVLVKCCNFQAKQMINLLLFNNFYPVISYRRVRKKKKNKATNCSVTRYGPRASCQRKGLNLKKKKKNKLRNYTFTRKMESLKIHCLASINLVISIIPLQ